MLLGVLDARGDDAPVAEDAAVDLEPARLCSAADAVHKSPAAVESTAAWED